MCLSVDCKGKGSVKMEVGFLGTVKVRNYSV